MYVIFLLEIEKHSWKNSWQECISLGLKKIIPPEMFFNGRKIFLIDRRQEYISSQQREIIADGQTAARNIFPPIDFVYWSSWIKKTKF